MMNNNKNYKVSAAKRRLGMNKVFLYLMFFCQTLFKNDHPRRIDLKKNYSEILLLSFFIIMISCKSYKPLYYLYFTLTLPNVYSHKE